MSFVRNLKISVPGDQPNQQQKTGRVPRITPKTLQHVDERFFTPQSKKLTKKPNFQIKISPNMSTKRETVPSIATERLRSSPIQRDTPRKNLFRLKKPGDMRVTVQSLKSLNFSSTVRIDESDDKDNEDELFTQRLKEQPIKEENIVSLDEMPHETCGDDAIEEFYNHYKHLDKICDVNGFKNVKPAMYTTFLKKTEDLCLFPSKIGLVKEKGTNDRLKINNFRIGDKYAAVLSEGLKSAPSFNKFELANNRLTPAGADVILSKLQCKPQAIDLSGNSIGKIGCEHLCNLLIQRNTRLLHINLEGNKLGDYAVSNLLEAIGDNETVKRLNLSRNFLTNKAAEEIGEMLKNNSSLEELYLRWNQIKGKGGEAIIEGMKHNPHLRVLDISWNSLGLVGGNFAQKFAEFIAEDETLLHLDLSNNYFNKNASLIIAKGLESNHSLYGLHYQGNIGYIDPKGFLIVEGEFAQETLIQSVQPPIDGVQLQTETLKRYHQSTEEFKDACWICEGWRPIEVRWEPGSSGSADQEPIYCHLSYEGYKGRYLSKKKDYYSARMGPPVAFGHLFTIDDNEHVIAENQPTKEHTGVEIKMSIDNKSKKYKPEFLNWTNSSVPKAIFNEYFELDEEIQRLNIKPREADEVYVPPEVRIERPKWKFQISSFREYRPDNQALLDKCFEVDFENTRISKIVKNEGDLKSVKDLLHSIYRPLKDCYKHYAAIGAPSEIWSIPLNTYTEFCLSSGIIDGKLMKLSDFDRVFIATYTKTDKEKNPRNPERALVRYQFMEGLVRLADQKYIANSLATTYKDALKMLIDESVKPFISKFDHQKWRMERYWNEEVDCIVKSYTPILKGAYKKYSGLKTLPGQRKFMSLEEFNNLVGHMDLLTDGLGERDATLFYSIAMMTQVDELGSDRIFQMQYIEFVEALTRAADKYSAAPYGKNQNEMTFEQRTQQPLHVKLEGLMQRLYNVCGNDVKDIWIMPQISIFDLPEVKGKQKFFTKKRNIVRVDPTDVGSMDCYGV